MPEGQVCKSRVQGNFYSLYNYSSQQNITLSEVIAWYSSRLSGFKMTQAHKGKSPQTCFTTLMEKGNFHGQIWAYDENTKAHGVAYERYQPGLAEKTITSLTQGKIVCQ